MKAQFMPDSVHFQLAYIEDGRRVLLGEPFASIDEAVMVLRARRESGERLAGEHMAVLVGPLLGELT